ncbi:multidrug effflux MFS transporter [Pseudomonas viridiflava]|uniref:multidrug effflux MFS transporter n=1 Tax=Pseudomonas viridiflava TaxID=33069 RepID=UPI000F0361B1|nr:multidrug effflux MFS transporter [Pseudomonas viridiflava]MEE4074856.1 multidrug effflux MFS transporter [Pseudomonas viridiflava]
MSVSRPLWLYILLLGAVTALPPLSIDMGLPAIADISRALGVSLASASQTLSVFIFGFVLGPLLFGPLSDRVGRRPILLTGLVVFTMAGIACTFAQDITLLLSARFLQGCAAGAAATLPIAIVRDRFEGVQARKLQSHLALVNNLAPLIAPLLGSAILVVGNWRWIYAALTVCGVILWLRTQTSFDETATRKSSNAAASLLTSYLSVLKSRRFLVSTLIMAFNFAGMFAYIATSPLVFMNNLGMTSAGFAALFALTAMGTIAGSWVNGKLIHAGVAEHRVLGGALLASLLISLGLVVESQLAIYPLYILTALVVLSNMCTGIVMPNATHSALEDLSATAGAGAALLRATQMLGGACASLLASAFYDGQTSHAMAGVMLACAVLGALTFVIGYRSVMPHPFGEQAG